jgi:hypothetical protein
MTSRKRIRYRWEIPLGNKYFLFYPMDSIEDFLKKPIKIFFPNRNDNNEIIDEKDTKSQDAKKIIKAWLSLIQSAMSTNEPEDKQPREFLINLFGEEEWQSKSQSIINTLCSKLPQEWIDDFQDENGIIILKEDENMFLEYDSIHTIIVYQQATTEDIEITLGFLDSLVN